MAASKEPTEPHPLNGHFSKFEDAAEVETLVKAGEYVAGQLQTCLLYTSPSPRDQRGSRMPSSA